MTRRNANPRLRGAFPGALFALLTLFLVQSVGAAPAAAKKQPKKKSAAAAVKKPVRARVPVSGLKAYIDPATGRLIRPSVDDTRPVESRAGAVVVPEDRPAVDVPVEKLANGAEMAHLDERYHEFEVARIGPDGKLVRECVQGSTAATALRKTPVKAAPAKRELK
jgi:hypothetical protein